MTGADALAGTWVVAAVGGVPVPAGGEPPAIDFDGAGRLAGHAGVNRISAPYALTGDMLTVGPVIATRMAGPPEWTDVETRLLAALSRPVAVTIEDGRLTLGVSTPVVLDRAPAAPGDPAG